MTEPLQVQIHLLPGGRMPIRMSATAAGYDVFLRAIVSPFEMDPSNPVFRKTLFDFEECPKDPGLSAHVHNLGDKLVYRMEPNETVLVGIGFVTAMPDDVFYWTAPRSGLASKHGITITNAPGTVDSDYRGEAGVLVYNRNEYAVDLEHQMRIAQIIFQRALFPDFQVTENYEELTKTDRGAGGFGSTGI